MYHIYESPFYPKNELDPNDAFGALCPDIATLQENKQVFHFGDITARIGNMQFQPIVQYELDKEEAFEIDPMWHRLSKDDVTFTWKGIKMYNKWFAHAGTQWNASISGYKGNDLSPCKWRF